MSTTTISNPELPHLDQITPGVGAAGTPAAIGIFAGGEREKDEQPEPIADPLEAAEQIEREEEERGEARPVNISPEPGDIAGKAGRNESAART